MKIQSFKSLKTFGRVLLAGVMSVTLGAAIEMTAWAEEGTEGTAESATSEAAAEAGADAESASSGEAAESGSDESSATEAAGTNATASEACETLDVNGECQADFGAALAYLKNNTEKGSENTMTLRGDLTDADESYYQITRNVTIDLNGHTLSTGRYFLVYGKTVRLTGNGTINLGHQTPFMVLGSTDASVAADWTHFIVDEGVTLNSTKAGWTYMIGLIMTNYKDYKYGITVDFNGAMTEAEGTTNVGFYTNGTINDGTVVFNIGESARIDVYDGALISGTATVNFAGKMNAGMAGIEMRAGELNVTGGSISAAATYQVAANGSGGTTQGAAIAVAQHTTKRPVKVNIAGGVFMAEVPFSEANPQKNDEAAIAQVTGEISGGKFIATGEREAVISEDLSGFIRGGTFSVEPEEKMLAEGMVVYRTGANYTVLPEVSTDTEDEVSGDADEGNIAELETIVSEAVAGILERYEELEATEYELGDGLSIRIDDVAGLKAAIESGKTISAKLVASDGDITASLPAEEAAALYGKLDEKATALGVIDFSIILTADGETALAHVTELGETVDLSFDASNVPEVAEGATRSYVVVRYHKGVAEELDDVEYDAGNALVSWTTDKFSSFLIAYVDVVEEDAEDDNSAAAAGVPNTGVFGENGGATASLVGAVAVVTIASVIYIRRRA